MQSLIEMALPFGRSGRQNFENRHCRSYNMTKQIALVTGQRPRACQPVEKHEMDVHDNKTIEISQAGLRVSDRMKRYWTLAELVAWVRTRRPDCVRAMDGFADLAGIFELSFLCDDSVKFRYSSSEAVHDTKRQPR